MYSSINTISQEKSKGEIVDIREDYNSDEEKSMKLPLLFFFFVLFFILFFILFFLLILFLFVCFIFFLANLLSEKTTKKQPDKKPQQIQKKSKSQQELAEDDALFSRLAKLEEQGIHALPPSSSPLLHVLFCYTVVRFNTSFVLSLPVPSLLPFSPSILERRMVSGENYDELIGEEEEEDDDEEDRYPCFSFLSPNLFYYFFF